MRSLNSMLQDRAPKDPPPPRRSKRTSEEGEPEVEEPKLKRSKTDGSVDEKDVGSAQFANSAISAAAAQASLSQTELVLNANDGEGKSSAKSTDEAKARKKRELNVGKSIELPPTVFFTRQY